MFSSTCRTAAWFPPLIFPQHLRVTNSHSAGDVCFPRFGLTMEEGYFNHIAKVFPIETHARWITRVSWVSGLYRHDRKKAKSLILKLWVHDVARHEHQALQSAVKWAQDILASLWASPALNYFTSSWQRGEVIWAAPPRLWWLRHRKNTR